MRPDNDPPGIFHSERSNNIAVLLPVDRVILPPATVRIQGKLLLDVVSGFIQQGNISRIPEAFLFGDRFQVAVNQKRIALCPADKGKQENKNQA